LQSVKQCDCVERPINGAARLRDCCLVFLNEPPEKGKAPLILAAMQGCAHSPSGHKSPSETFVKRRWRYPYDEGVDEPGKHIEIESVEVEAEVLAEETEPIERIEKPDRPEKQPSKKTNPPADRAALASMA
jgi:hypothetical protein